MRKNFLDVILGIALLGSIVLIPAAAHASALGDAAAAMQPGEWRAFTAANLNQVFGGVITGSSNNIIPYAEDMVWDSVGQQILLVAGDHILSPPSDYPRFARYSIATNSWEVLARPSWFPANTMHGYDQNAFSSATRNFYFHTADGTITHKYNIASGSWSTIANLNAAYSCCEAFGYFPELGGMIAPHLNQVFLYKEATNSWEALGITGLTRTSYHSITEYNPVHKVMLFGGGTDGTSGNLYKLDSSKTITPLNPPPVGIEVPRSAVTVDPITGDYLVFDNTKKFYKYNIITDTWTAQPNAATAVPIWNSDPASLIGGVVHVPIPDYGVTMFITCDGGSCKTNLYKSASASAPPPADTVVPSIPANLSATVISSTQINLSWSASTDNVGVTNYQLERCSGAGCTSFAQIAAPVGASFSNTTVAAATTYQYRVRAADAAGNVSGYSNIVSGTTPSGTPVPPPTGGGLPIPSLQDERNTYTKWAWTWDPGLEPNLAADATYSVGNPDIHNDTEGDDLWSYLMMYRRTGQQGYLDRARAWADYFKNRYRTSASFPNDTSFLNDHLYGWGLVAWYEYTCETGTCDTTALIEAENLGAIAEGYWSNRSPGWRMAFYSLRQGARHLLLATRLAEVTGKARWITLRDKLIDLWLASPDWDPRGMYFHGSEQTDIKFGAGAYATGDRYISSFQISILSEAFHHTYRTTGRTGLRDRIVSMARFVNQYGLDPTYQYVGSTFGILRDGSLYHNYSAGGTATFWDPVYTTSLVNVLIQGYKYTGDIALLDKAKTVLNRGTKGVYGSPTARAASDTQVHHFIDSTFESSSGGFYLGFNKGELQYTYMIFENGGNPSIETGASPPANIAPAISVISTNPADAVPGTPGIQFYEGTSVTYSATASDANGDPLSWTWYYTINGGARVSYASGTGSIAPATFTYAVGTAGATYQWIISVSDSILTTEQTLNVGVVAVPPPDPSGTVFPVIAGGDDAYESSTFNTSGMQGWMGFWNNVAEQIGLRFQNITIPQRATITSAALTVQAGTNEDDTNTVFAKIRGKAVDNAGIWDAVVNRISQGPYTTAGVDWDTSPWVNNSTQVSPSLVSIIQEIVNRTGWTSGNSLALVILNDGTAVNADRSMMMFEGGAVGTPRLTIGWSTGTSTSDTTPPAVPQNVRVQ